MTPGTPGGERALAALERAERVLEQMASRTPEARAASMRAMRRRGREAGRRLFRAVVAVALVLAATTVIGFFQPIQLFGFVAAILLALTLAAIILSIPTERRRAEAPESPGVPTAALVHRLDEMLLARRPALPRAALPKVDAISRQLPLLEHRLADIDPLDPLAQDARRLVGRHLPDLLERYERVPAAQRREVDPEGLTVEARLDRGLDAARAAVDDLTRRLSEGDLRAFDTQRRFLETRYKDPELPAS